MAEIIKRVVSTTALLKVSVTKVMTAIPSQLHAAPIPMPNGAKSRG